MEVLSEIWAACRSVHSIAVFSYLFFHKGPCPNFITRVTKLQRDYQFGFKTTQFTKQIDQTTKDRRNRDTKDLSTNHCFNTLHSYTRHHQRRKRPQKPLKEDKPDSYLSTRSSLSFSLPSD
jgi:hypothetical protein